ncbi:Proline dehydrogenase 1, mitochondrial [Triplophysa tibetana]|uniref:Proline dehydrogenase n=1 Tax=Triplophysa tibetana TaxID=1572043 RepID=A0A5A9P808_9TELE|nr:Proline dehydrogenase 1, mitochondrial [Triplophysa tibetana]
MDHSRTFLGQKMFKQFMKMTFYGQFVAGEDHESIRPLIQKNQAYGVGAVLDYCVEEDLSQEEAEKEGDGSLCPYQYCINIQPNGSCNAVTQNRVLSLAFPHYQGCDGEEMLEDVASE